MRRLALLLAGGALWLILAASAAYADGGPHQLTVNNGTAGLSGDCAACHRAHTAQAADLLKSSMPGLCLTCHDGTGATTDVVDGVQFAPATYSGTPATDPVLGALRGGGFEYALMDSANASRLSYSSRGGVVLTFGAAPATGSVTLSWPAIPSLSFAASTLAFNYNSTAAEIQVAADSVFGVSAAYSSSTVSSSMTGLPVGGSNMVVTKTATTVSFAPQNAFRIVEIPLPTVSVNTTGQTAAVTNGISVGGAGHVGVVAYADKAAVTSTHEGLGTVWGNGPQGQGNVGATGVALECTNCHNPHGNGQYRILNTLPGEDWSNGTVQDESTTLAANVTTGFGTSIDVTSAAGFPTKSFTIKVDTEQMTVTGGFGTTTWTVVRGANGTTPDTHIIGHAVALVTASWTAPANAVEVKDGATLTASQVRNYTILPSTNGLTTGVVGTAADGDYWRYKYDPTGAANFTNFYLKADEMNTGWNGTSKTNKATNGNVSPANSTGLMTAWCITCHTRYNGYSTAGTTSLVAATPVDSIFMYKHGTTRVGCEQCHVSHGSNAAMTGPAADLTFPDGSVPEDSALLKADNRGTCQLCHDPTGTVTAGTTVGSVPLLITPGP